MSIGEFIETSTYGDARAVTTVAAIRRRYEQEIGQKINRTAFVGGLVAAGYTVAADSHGRCVVVGRSLTPPKRYRVIGGKAVLVAA